MAYTLAEFAKLDLRRYAQSSWRHDFYGRVTLGEHPPEGELFLPADIKCDTCNGYGTRSIPLVKLLRIEQCPVCEGTGIFHE